MRSTSAAIHVLNGVVIHSTSRTQKVSCGEIKQVRTLYNVADLNTEALNKDCFMCLL